MSDGFANRFQHVIESAGKSKAAVSSLLGVSAAYVSQLCSGIRTPSDRTISDICREFGCNEVWLRTGEGEPFQQESREEAIMRFAASTIRGSDSFKKALVSTLAELSPEDWEKLGDIFRKLADEMSAKE